MAKARMQVAGYGVQGTGYRVQDTRYKIRDIGPEAQALARGGLDVPPSGMQMLATTARSNDVSRCSAAGSERQGAAAAFAGAAYCLHQAAHGCTAGSLEVVYEWRCSGGGAGNCAVGQVEHREEIEAAARLAQVLSSPQLLLDRDCQPRPGRCSPRSTKRRRTGASKGWRLTAYDQLPCPERAAATPRGCWQQAKTYGVSNQTPKVSLGAARGA